MMAADSNKPLLGLFHPSTMNVYIDREMLKNPEVLGKYTDQPNLINMTEKNPWISSARIRRASSL